MNQVKLIALIFVFFLGTRLSGKNEAHDSHVSKCNIDFSNEEKTLQITMHIYLDDLESDIAKGGVTEKLHLLTEKEHADGDKFLLEYFQKKFKLQVNQKNVSYNFLGKEITEDLLGGWFYLEVENVQELKDLKINYEILTDLYNDQQSVIKIKGPNQKKGYLLLDSKKKEANVTF